MPRLIPSMLFSATLMLSGALALPAASAASAADSAPPATGTLTGKVVDNQGAPAKGVTVAAFEAGAFAERRIKPTADTPAPGKARVEPLVKTTTADDGTYTLAHVPVEKVRILAGAKGVGLGYSRELVQVKAGETTKVPDIQLHPAATEHPKAQHPPSNP